MQAIGKYFGTNWRHDCIDPLQNNELPSSIVNIVTGKVVVNPSVNVDSVRLRKEQIKGFENSWPEGFHDRISKQIITMSIYHKHIRVADTIVYDIKMIHGTDVGLHCNLWDYHTKKLMANESIPQPT